MNKNINLNRLEFIVTHTCSSKCKHCSNVSDDKESVLDIAKAEKAIHLAADKFPINSIMTFGGEPLLYPDIIFAINRLARKKEIPVREIITNCYWTNNKNRIDEIAIELKESGATDVLVSIDAFHQEYIPFDVVIYSLEKLQKQKFKRLSINPCWYDSPEGDNKYDKETRRLLKEITYSGINIGSGNVMFAEGRAVHNFTDKFKKISSFEEICCTDIPYCDSPEMITSICLNPDGKINICDIGEMEVYDFFENYNPKNNKAMKMFLENKYDGLLDFAREQGVFPEKEGYYSLCSACIDLRKKLRKV